MALLIPPGVFVTVTVLGPAAAVDAITKRAAIVLAFCTVLVTSMSVAGVTLTVVPVFTKLVPFKVTGTVLGVAGLLPLGPDGGKMEVSVGATAVDAVTVNVMVLVVPPGAVMLTVLAVAGALISITKFAETELAFSTFMPVTVMPVSDTLTAVAPVRLVPLRVT